MKKAIVTLAILIFAPLRAEILPTLGLGEEKIEPLWYPKFTLSGDYAGDLRLKNLQNKNIKARVRGKFDAGLGIEVGIVKYLNAGFDFTYRQGALKGQSSPLGLRFPLFLKPYFPITDRFSIFLKTQIGPALTFVFPSQEGLFMNNENMAALMELYKNGQYGPMSYGLTTSAAAGIDVFFWSRIGISLQWGVRYDIYRANIANREHASDSPSGLSFSAMDFPITATLQLIL